MLLHWAESTHSCHSRSQFWLILTVRSVPHSLTHSPSILFSININYLKSFSVRTSWAEFRQVEQEPYLIMHTWVSYWVRRWWPSNTLFCHQCMQMPLACHLGDANNSRLFITVTTRFGCITTDDTRWFVAFTVAYIERLNRLGSFVFWLGARLFSRAVVHFKLYFNKILFSLPGD